MVRLTRLVYLTLQLLQVPHALASPYRCNAGLSIPLRLPSQKKAIQAPAFSWGKEPMRGVNIGGWLVLEPWITPSLFESKPSWVVDEWTYGAYMATQNDSMSEIENHWNTWFTYADIENIARVGLNTIRVQIGFWSLIDLVDGEPYVVGAFEYLKLVVKWAQGLGLKVMLDLHGAPGGQNGFDNSGLRWTRQWFWNQTNMDRTISALTVLTQEFTKSTYGDTIIAVELLNEPFPQADWEVGYLETFYKAAYTAVRSASQDGGITIAIDEAFQGLERWDGFMIEPGWNNVALDTHIYSMFDTKLLTMGYNENIRWSCSKVQDLIDANNQHWTIVGEFTPANTDCAYWLNGRGSGARYDNTLEGATALAFKGDCSKKTGADGSAFGADYFDHLAVSWETQTWVYEKASGWIMWTWKTERAADWSMADGITNGWIPSPIYSKPHGTPCNFTPTFASETNASSAAILATPEPSLSLAVTMAIGWTAVLVMVLLAGGGGDIL